MSTRLFMGKYRRFLPIVGGVVVLSVAGALFTGGTTSSEPHGESLASAQRSVDDTATRGAQRTSETLPAAVVAEVMTTIAPVTSTTTSTTTKPVSKQTGVASYYSQPWANKGCAHKTLPKGTVLTVTNVATGRSATCVVNDRGPYVAGRIVDLDTTIFRQLASTSAGVFRASITW